MRVGHALPELLDAGAVRYCCGAASCGAELDAFGFHPGICKGGNRGGLWTQRHDVIQHLLVSSARLLGVSTPGRDPLMPGVGCVCACDFRWFARKCDGPRVGAE